MAGHPKAPRVRVPMTVIKDQVRRVPQLGERPQQHRNLAKAKQAWHIRKCEGTLRPNPFHFGHLRNRYTITPPRLPRYARDRAPRPRPPPVGSWKTCRTARNGFAASVESAQPRAESRSNDAIAALSLAYANGAAECCQVEGPACLAKQGCTHEACLPKVFCGFDQGQTFAAGQTFVSGL